jgi:hypothetical protein
LTQGKYITIVIVFVYVPRFTGNINRLFNTGFFHPTNNTLDKVDVDKSIPTGPFDSTDEWVVGFPTVHFDLGDH